MDDPFVYSNPRDLVGAHHMTGKRALEQVESRFMARELTKQQTNVEEDILDEARRPRLADVDPRYGGYRVDDLKGLLNSQIPQPVSPPPYYAKGHSIPDHSIAITQPRTYQPFPDRRPVSRTPSSPSMYLPTLSATDDQDSASKLSNPTSIACQTNTTVPDRIYDHGANPKRRSLYRATVLSETPMTRPGSEGDQSSPDVVQQKPPCDKDKRPIPPLVPPKSPLRADMRIQTMYTQREILCSPRSLFSI